MKFFRILRKQTNAIMVSPIAWIMELEQEIAKVAQELWNAAEEVTQEIEEACSDTS